MRNGRPFLHEFFWKQHFERYLTPALQHVQPFWYYIPVVLAAVFPWTPLVALFSNRKTFDDVRIRFLAGWLVYALVFLSAGKNKLPGYVLPVLPAMAIVLAVGLEKAGAQMKWWLAATVVMLLALPAIAAALPSALLAGIRRAPVALVPSFAFVLLILAAAGGIWFLAWRERTALAVMAAGLAIGAGVIYLKQKTFPILEDRVSVRAFWRTNRIQAGDACLDPIIRREWQYGLNYYAARPLADCADASRLPRITVRNEQLVVEPR